MSTARVIVGDCRAALPAMEPDSFDAIVTDPPYELGFMGKRWDGTGIAFLPATWAACLRVLKPGGRLLAFGAPRTSHRIWCAIEDAGFVIEDTAMWLFGSGFPKHRSKLKPAYEPICVARKGPVSELNIDGCRITTVESLAGGAYGDGRKTHLPAINPSGLGRPGATPSRPFVQPPGRWPANVMLDEDAAAMLDEQSGTDLQSGAWPARRSGIGYQSSAQGTVDEVRREASTGGASRFFYTAKASRSERNAGLDGMPTGRAGMMQDDAYEWPGTPEHTPHRTPPAANHHPTVKPVELMRYLVRLVTPNGGTVLDPFCGSGSTGVACTMEGRDFTGIELSPEYATIAERRIRQTQPSLFGDGAA